MNFVLIDNFVNILAFLGCIFYGLNTLQFRHFDLLAKKVGFLIGLVSFVFLLRILQSIFDLEVFTKLLLSVPFFIPFFILITAEALLKMHSSLVLKILTTVCIIAGVVTFFWPPKDYHLMASATSAVAIVLTCLMSAFWIIKSSQHFEENSKKIANIFSASLIFITPFVLSDFSLLMGIDIRFGAVGVLIGLFILLRTTIDNVNLKQPALEIVFIILFSMPLGFLGYYHSEDIWIGVGMGNASLVLLITLGILTRVLSLYVDGSRFRVFNELAKIDNTSQENFLFELKNVLNFSVKKAEELHDYDLDLLKSSFSKYSVWSLREIEKPDLKKLSIEETEQIQHLLNSNKASHITLIEGSEPILILFYMPPLGNEKDTSALLNVVHKLASMTFEREKKCL